MMTPERWQQVKAVLNSALEREPSERARFLTEACAGDESMRREVEALLLSYDRAGSLFEMPAMEVAAQALAEDHAESLLGRDAGPYKILSQLGTGGMGEVYLAHDARLGRKVALKLLPPYFTRDAERLRRFQQEASAASRLNHPNILTIYEVGQINSTHYIATEYIDGLTLRELMTQKQISIGEALDAAMQIASALSAAHSAGIVHRDIKPENIMLRRDGYLKVLDFGLAKLTENPREQQPSDSEMATGVFVKTDPGTVMGTISYMSPEQARGLEVDAGTDIWSLGVVLYEMVAGRVPFEGSSVADVLVAILEREPTPLAQNFDLVPPELEEVVRKTLSKDQSRRYSSIDEMAHDLCGIKQELEFEARLRGSRRRDSTAAERSQLEAPSLEKRAGHANNLSVQLPTIIGRSVEVSEVEELLRQEEVRLVTLTGPGGTGKTRLSQQVAKDLLDVFDDGVFFVALAPISNYDLVASAIAQTLGVQETSERAFAEGLKNYLRDKKMLLVLDNFEHVLTASPLVAELLSACPGLKILVTSRAVLHISDECEFQVPPLTLPEPDSVQSVEDLTQYGSSALFVQRMLALKPQSVISDENAPTIAEICIRLDGLPLAIELAAARIKLLTLNEMLDRLNQRLKLLKGGARDLPARHQTMRATIAWSYDLLGENEKRLFQRQSVFFGGFTLSAAEAVCGVIEGVEIDVLEGLAALVDESLVSKKEMPDGAYRFLMLETIREYGLERLSEGDEAEALRRRHAGYFLKLAEKVEPHLMGAGHELWLKQLDAERDNLRAALRWAADNAEAELGLRLAGALRWFWYHGGHFGEGYHWAKELLTMRQASARTPARAKALMSAGSLAFYYSDPAAACPLLEESAAIWRELGDSRYLGYTLMFMTLPILLSRHDFPSASAFATESVTLFRNLDDRWGLALSLTYAGVIMWTEPEFENEATTLFEESVALFRELGDEWGASGSLLYLGAIRQEHGENAAARSLYEETVAINRKANDIFRLASALDILAELLRSEGQHSRAEVLTEESLTLQRKLGKSLNMRKAWDQMKRRSRHEASR
ncbi:MAG: protein kinase [Pyrinomonadaceae bacterium]